MSKKAFILSEGLIRKIEQIQKEMNLKESGDVLSKAINLLSMSLGRKVILQDTDSDSSIEISDLSKYKKIFYPKSNGSHE